MMETSSSTSQLLQNVGAANEKTWLQIGTCAELMGDEQNAMIAFDKVLSQNPHNLKALIGIGVIHKNKKAYGKATECFQRVLHVNAKDGAVWGHLGYCYLMMNEIQNAYTAYQHALYHIPEPKDPKLWYGIGLLYDRYGSLEHAAEAFEAVLKMDPAFDMVDEVRLRLGIIAKQQGRYDSALEGLRQILDDEPSADIAADVWAQIGHVYEFKEQIDLAKTAYEKVVDINPRNATALQQLGWLCYKSGRENHAAVKFLKKATEVDPEDGKGWYLLGRCHMVDNDYEDAYRAYKQAVACDPGNPNVWCSLGVLFFQLSQYMDALDAYSRAINLNPNICEVWCNVGTLYDTCNQVGDARDAYQKAIELGAKSSFIRERFDALSHESESGTPRPMSSMSSAPPKPSEPPTTAPMSLRSGPAVLPPGNTSMIVPSPASISGGMSVGQMMSRGAPPTNAVSGGASSAMPRSSVGVPSMSRSDGGPSTNLSFAPSSRQMSMPMPPHRMGTVNGHPMDSKGMGLGPPPMSLGMSGGMRGPMGVMHGPGGPPPMSQMSGPMSSMPTMNGAQGRRPLAQMPPHHLPPTSMASLKSNKSPSTVRGKPGSMKDK